MVVVHVVAGIQSFCFEDGVIGKCVAYWHNYVRYVGGWENRRVCKQFFSSFFVGSRLSHCLKHMVVLHSSRQYEDNRIQCRSGIEK